MSDASGWRAWDDGDGVIHVRGTVMAPRAGCTAELQPWKGNWGPTPFYGVLEVVIHEPPQPTQGVMTPIPAQWDQSLCASPCQQVEIKDGDDSHVVDVEPGGPDK